MNAPMLDYVDLTLIYYTANRIDDAFASVVRAELADATHGRYPVVVVSQGPIRGYRFSAAQWDATFLDVGLIGASAYNVYRQILAGARAARTPYVAMAEDDSLYTAEHFAFRPPPGVFAYNRNRWVLTRRLSADGQRREAVFYWRERTQMAQCICARDLLIETLEERFAKYPDPLTDAQTFPMGWGEPGRYEKNLGITRQTRAYFDTALPNVTFNHAASIRGRRQMKVDDRQAACLAPWGDATALWDRVHG